MEPKPGIIACLRCKTRKIRCDRAMPKCTNCEKTNLPCLTVDPATGRQVPRSYLSHLESRVKQLEQELELSRKASSTAIPAYAWIPETEFPYNGESSGFSMAARLGQTLHEQANISKSKFGNLGHVASNGQPIKISKQGDPWSLLVDLPRKREAEERIKWYFEQCNATYPILHREQFIQQYFEPVYGPIDHDLQLCSKYTTLSLRRSNAEPGTGTFYRRWVDCGNSMTAVPEPHIQCCLYFLYIVFALGTVTDNRVSTKDPAAGPRYLGAAMTYYSVVASAGPQDSQYRGLQAILLLCVYGIMMPMTPSAWYTIGNAMRMCIDMGLHRADQAEDDACDSYTADMKRRLFWTTYYMDRMVSISLGRPVNITDEFIDCPLPTLVDDSWLMYERNSDAQKPSAFLPPDRPSYKWVFHSMLQLRQIQYRIKFELYDRTDASSPNIRGRRDDLALELENWKKSIPWDESVFNFDWNTDMFRVNYNYSRILLYRNSRGIPEPTLEETRILLDTGINLLEIYVGFGELSYLVYTWLAAHNILQAATSCLHALCRTQCLHGTFDLDSFEVLIGNTLGVMDKLRKASKANDALYDAFANISRITFEYLRKPRTVKRRKLSMPSSPQLSDRTTAAPQYMLETAGLPNVVSPPVHIDRAAGSSGLGLHRDDPLKVEPHPLKVEPHSLKVEPLKRMPNLPSMEHADASANTFAAHHDIYSTSPYGVGSPMDAYGKDVMDSGLDDVRINDILSGMSDVIDGKRSSLPQIDFLYRDQHYKYL